MKKLCTILFISIFQFSESSDFKLICNEIGISYDKNFSGSFTKIVNFENRTVSNYSGNYFDKVVMFNEKEIILNNKVFQISSTYDIKRKIWTSYKGLYLKKYRCSKKKRRF